MSGERWSLLNLPPDWPTAHLQLIDALRAYIWADESVGKELLDDRQITRDQYDEAAADREPYVKMLRELEEHGVDPSLHGLIKDRLP
jgi:hypothetical protein